MSANDEGRELSERGSPNPGLLGQRLSHPGEVLSPLWPPCEQTSALETFLPSAARDAVQSLLLMSCAAGLRGWVNWLIGNRPIGVASEKKKKKKSQKKLKERRALTLDFHVPPGGRQVLPGLALAGEGLL